MNYSYWWDFDKDVTKIIVESDRPKFKTVKEFPFDSMADFAIEQAERLIKDLKEGRISLKNILTK